MGNSLRCCIACLIPCGALDVIRIVHLNGHVDEFSRPVSAQEILTAHPGHVLSTPCSPDGSVAGGGRILIVSPESELKRGVFYFLVPASSVPDKKKIRKKNKSQNNSDDDKPKEKVECKRKRSGRVGVWRPRLDSISEDPIS